MPRLMIRLCPEATARLIKLASQERRRPADQAAWLIEHNLPELPSPSDAAVRHAPTS